MVRALAGWQDTNNNQWIAFAADSSTATELGAIQCTVSGSTGLTTATGAVKNITPLIASSQSAVTFFTTAGSSQLILAETNFSIATNPNTASVFITTPVSVGGLILQGLYNIIPISPGSSSFYFIEATDILGNPAPAQWGNIGGNTGPANISSVTFTAGTPNTLTIVFSIPGGVPPNYTFTPGDNVNINVADNSITGSYIVGSSTVNEIIVATGLSSYTFSTTGSLNNLGVVPLYVTSAVSYIVIVQFPFHGQVVGGDWFIANPTQVGGLTLYGEYQVQSVLDQSVFTIYASSNASSTAGQYQNAIAITGGSGPSGGHIVIDWAAIYTHPFNSAAFAAQLENAMLLQNINPASWNGWRTPTSGGTSSVALLSTGASGSYISGGTFSPLGGVVGLIYNFVSLAPDPGVFPATFWSMDTYGDDLLAVPGNSPIINYPTHPLSYQPLYMWDPLTGFQAGVNPNAPAQSNGVFVAMPQRQIVLWGSNFDQGVIDTLTIRWSDVNNPNVWVAQSANQAGSFRLASGSAIIGARQSNQQGLIWTDIELWSMQYIGYPLVYGFNKIGVGCGLIGKYAHGVLGGITYWMSKTQIWMLSGDGTIAIPCPIWDVVFQDLDLVNADKITCATNAMFQEITWYFPVKSGTGENSNYIKLNVSGLAAGQPPIWDYGILDRSAWIDVSVLQQPIGFSPVNEFIYQHEISPDADGLAMGETFTTGWFALAEGDVMPFVDQVWPDFKWGYFGQSQNANVNLTISGADYPGLATQTVGPYTVTQSSTWISPRMRHRLLSFTVAGTGTGTWWRLGGIRYRYQAVG